MWLTIDNIEEKEKDAAVIEKPADVPDIVGSGQSVGGIVSETVGVGTETENSPIQVTASNRKRTSFNHVLFWQLQRIVSRCKCEFFYACYGDNSLDPGSIDQVPPPPTDEGAGPWEQREQGVDAFTLMHHDLDVCTNSLQVCPYSIKQHQTQLGSVDLSQGSQFTFRRHFEPFFWVSNYTLTHQNKILGFIVVLALKKQVAQKN